MTRRPTDSPNWGGNRRRKPGDPPCRAVLVRLPIELINRLDALPGTRTSNMIALLNQSLRAQS